MLVVQKTRSLQNVSYTKNICAAFFQNQYRMAGLPPPPMPWHWKKKNTHYIANVGI
jgi:hypothetical protein